jgi:hypothetical protein
MRARHRYGDAGTEVTASEKVVAALFVVGLVALLVPHHRAPPDEQPPTVVQPSVAMPPPAAIAAGGADAYGLVPGSGGGPAGDPSVHAVAAPQVNSDDR